MNKRIEERKSGIIKLPAQKIKMKTLLDCKAYMTINISNILLEILEREEVEDVMTDNSEILVEGAIRRKLPTQVIITADLKGIREKIR